MTLIGDHEWSDVSVTADLTGDAYIGARSMWSPASYENKKGCGVYFGVSASDGKWHMAFSVEKLKQGQFAHSGPLPSQPQSGGRVWHQVLLSVAGTRGSAKIDGQLVLDSVTVPTCNGWVALLAGKYAEDSARFDNIAISAA
eukprot:gb/GFBE01025683.1/.p1 GENE.gb/GFBE01025683.1/~~gb/GFBE01025683.1/.p1  ORF type:complete len:142 (+),score=22.35 gb/GFBE01025683.1/:1-426(+)